MKLLSEAITLLEGHIQNTKIQEAKEILLEKLKNTPHENYEDRGIVYYYLLRASLQSNTHIETAILTDYLDKIIFYFHKQEKKYKQEIKKSKSTSMEHKVKIMQAKAFYKLIERYFSSLELLYRKKDFIESQTRTYKEKMRYRKDSSLLKKKYLTFFGYFLLKITSDYGNSFLRWGITTFVFIVFFGVILMVIDQWQTGGAMVKYQAPYNYFYFSVVAFTTVGFGDIVAITGLQKLIVSCEILSGYLMLGMLINLIQKKLW